MSVSSVSLEAYSLNLYMPRLLISQLVVVFARMTSVTLVSGDCKQTPSLLSVCYTIGSHNRTGAGTTRFAEYWN